MQPHAGIALKDNFFWPGLILLVVAMLGVTSTVAAAAYRHYEWLPTTLLITVLGVVAGALWLVLENRRVARIEAQWDAAHTGAPLVEPEARRRRPQPGGAKNSSAMPSGSRKLSPDP
jgi:uncharacterized membrane protein YcjF (UPF0283 family)